ncbi:MAG TPA: YafY family protein [Ktedonobacteraceae bacterium]|jgi:predicted DNA-binding transcriptional regulator YafY
MYFPATRVLTILEMLQSRQRLSGPELATRLEVNTRTVRRYITMLQDLGFPIEAERGRHGFYRLRPGFKLPPLMFTEEEALAMTLGLLAVRRLGLTVAAPAVEGALAKIERVLPQTLQDRVRAVQETLSLTFPPYTVNTKSETLLTLCTAAQLERRVFLSYQAWDGKMSEREADIYGLVYRGGYWYSVGYCHLRHGLRVFRLDRINMVEMRDDTFTRPLDFDCVDHVMRSLSNTPSTWPVEVLLETTLSEAQLVIPPATASLEETPQGVMMRCSVGNLGWLAEVLLTRLEWPFIIVQPPELRDELHKLAARLERMATRRLPDA